MTRPAPDTTWVKTTEIGGWGRVEPKKGTSVTWPLVALAVVGAGFIVAVLVVIPKEDAQSRSAVLGILVTLGAAAGAWFTRNKVNQVQDGVDQVNTKVNGRMTEMLAEIAESRKALDDARSALEREQAQNRLNNG